jgi:hypothetical protein
MKLWWGNWTDGIDCEFVGCVYPHAHMHGCECLQTCMCVHVLVFALYTCVCAKKLDTSAPDDENQKENENSSPLLKPVLMSPGEGVEAPGRQCALTGVT